MELSFSTGGHHISSTRVHITHAPELAEPSRDGHTHRWCVGAYSGQTVWPFRDHIPGHHTFLRRSDYRRSGWWWRTSLSLDSGLRRRTSDVSTPRPYTSDSQNCGSERCPSTQFTSQYAHVAGSNVLENGGSVHRINRSYHVPPLQRKAYSETDYYRPDLSWVHLWYTTETHRRCA